jgi:hypothetical protein
MKKIWKFCVDGGRDISMPYRADIIHTGCDPAGMVCVWAIVDPHAHLEKVRIRVYGTGWEMEHEGTHLATINKGAFVWHYFKVK